jgi:predicted PurR-regulated permease PerM
MNEIIMKIISAVIISIILYPILDFYVQKILRRLK